MLRIVIDTNVLISAVISNGKPRRLLKLAAQNHFLLIKSEDSMREFARVLRRPKFKITGGEARKAGQVLLGLGKTVKVTSSRRVVVADPNDDIFINTALDGNADYVVTGDVHLLDLAQYEGIEIVSVDSILRKLGF